MSAQTSYTQATPRGVAGGLVDLSTHAINTRLNGESGNAMKFGMGVVQGATPGSDVKIPATGATIEKFEGVTVNGYTSEMDRDGKVTLAPNTSVGVLQYGKIWVRIKAEDAPAYGDKLYLIVNGANAGLFTKTTSGDTIEVTNGIFIGGKGTGDVAPVELFYQKPVPAAGVGG